MLVLPRLVVEAELRMLLTCTAHRPCELQNAQVVCRWASPNALVVVGYAAEVTGAVQSAALQLKETFASVGHG